MPPKKGFTNNPNGRPKGTPNKTTGELRARISDFLSDNWETIEADFKSLEPEKRISLFEKLLQYAVPRMQAVQSDISLNNTDDTAEACKTFMQMILDEPD